MARPRKRSDTDLSRFLDQALKHSRMTHNGFCRLAGIPPATLSDLKLGREPDAPDRKTVKRWADILKLTADQGDELFELIQLAYSPPYVQDLVKHLKRGGDGRQAASPTDDYRPE